MVQYDLIIIGGGPTGEKAARRAAELKKKVALVEFNKELGGAVVTNGSLASKILRETILFFNCGGKSNRFEADSTDNLEEINDLYYRKKFSINSETKSILEEILLKGIKHYTGWAKLENQNTISIDNRGKLTKIRGDYILIATGSYPFHPSNIPFDFEKIHDSDSILNLKRFPKSLSIFGTGIVGCEFASMFALKKIPVTLMDSGNTILPFLDNEVSNEMLHIMKKSGIKFLFNEEIKDIYNPEASETNLKIYFHSGREISSDMFLFANGRNAKISGMNLDKLGIQTGDRNNILVNSNYQTNIPNIFAAGDVIGFPGLASTGMSQGVSAVNNIFSVTKNETITSIFPYGVYTVPEISMAGLTEDQAKKSKINYGIGKAYYKNIPKSKIQGIEDGFLKILYDRNSRYLLGVHIIGELATELIHFGVLMIESKMTLEKIHSMIYNFPTFHELYRYAIIDALNQTDSNE
ncbi:MAG: FAD-dependent oxidoreductase [Leptospiraceae bacterium]|nr:FAD-dependent oxidoreductase [Leptospiraceae bacterium]